MDIKNMTMEDIELRMSEIRSVAETADNPEELLTEIEALEERKAEIMKDAEKRAALVAKMATTTEVTEVRNFEEVEEMEERKIYTPDTAEYRDAFYAMIAGTATAEQRTIVVDNTAPGNGDAIAIPKSLDEKIWDGIHTAHPIIADVSTIHSGIALEVTKHTAISTRITKKLDKDATPAELENTFVKVVLFGYDYEGFVKLTYAEAKMSQGALEDYLADCISAEIGESLAKDVFAQILADAGSGQAVTSTDDLFDDVKKVLAKANLGGKKTIYAPSTSYYEIVGAIKSGSPFNMGAALGVEVKCDDAATCVVAVAPKEFVLNVVQDIMVESDRDIQNHKVIISGYLRAQGTLRKNKAAAYIG